METYQVIIEEDIVGLHTLQNGFIRIVIRGIIVGDGLITHEILDILVGGAEKGRDKA